MRAFRIRHRLRLLHNGIPIASEITEHWVGGAGDCSNGAKWMCDSANYIAAPCPHVFNEGLDRTIAGLCALRVGVEVVLGLRQRLRVSGVSLGWPLMGSPVLGSRYTGGVAPAGLPLASRYCVGIIGPRILSPSHTPLAPLGKVFTVPTFGALAFGAVDCI